MHPFENILVYASLEDEAFLALEQAASLARENGARITLVRILEGEGWFTRRAMPGSEVAEMRELLETNHRNILERQAEPLREAGLEIRVDVRWGRPWHELVSAVLEDGHDLVVKTAEGAARGSGLFFGSTALHLIRKCPCPVWIVGSVDATRSPRVLAAIDPSEDEVRTAVAKRVVNLASSMAGERGELHTATAWRADGELLLRSRMPLEELDAYVGSVRDETRGALERLLSSVGDPVAAENVHVVNGEARDVLPALVEREAFDLLVMGSLGRVGIAGLLIGETAETIIRSVRCSVLVVKPPGFVCPVEPRGSAG